MRELLRRLGRRWALLAAPCLAGLAAVAVAGDGPGRDAPRDGDGLRVVAGRGVPVRPATQRRRRTKGKAKTGAAQPTPPADAAPAKGEGAPAAEGELKFSRDIAPILVANCTGCHSPGQAGLRRGKLDLTTFEKLMEGTPKEKVIVPGKPEESHLVLRIKGEETPKMPQGGNRALSDEAVAKVERWVKAGALLDAGVERTAALASYAATPEDLRKADLAKKSPAERDKLVESVGLERWKKADPKAKPEVTSGAHFLAFGTLPKDRASAAVKAAEGQYTQLRALLGPSAVDLGEKVSLYVFNEAGSFNEFVRTVESREVEAGTLATSRLNVAEPYVAVIDPSGGRNEAPAAGRRPARGKRGDDAADAGAGRTLAGLVAEHYVVGTLEAAGKPPRWLSLGLAAKLASRAEPRGGYSAQLRPEAFDLSQQGWTPKANLALGGEAKTEDVRAAGFAMVEWMMTAADRSVMPAFVREMLAGGEKLDAVLGNTFNWGRAEFLAATGEFVQANYGGGR